MKVVGGDMSRSDKRKSDDPHRLLCIVRPVREGNEARSNELEPPKDAIDRSRCTSADQPKDAEHQRCREKEAEDGRKERRNEHLLAQTVPQDHVEAVRCDGCACGAANQRVA
jgi:hypothetical protein